jgi:hypothetical protein
MVRGHRQGNERPVIVNLIGLDIVLVYDQQQQVHADDSGDDEISLSDDTISDQHDSPIIGKEVPGKTESSSSSSCSSMITIQVGDSYLEDDSLQLAISRRMLQVGDSYFEDDSMKVTIARRVRLLPGNSFIANDDDDLLVAKKNAMETTTTLVVLKLLGSPDEEETKSSHATPPAAVATPDFLSTMKSLRISNSAA